VFAFTYGSGESLNIGVAWAMKMVLQGLHYVLHREYRADIG
jgi:hypothetical protein